MVNYELVYITRPDINETNSNAIKEKVKSVIEAEKGKLVSHDEWGKRKLAYPIAREIKGTYFIVRYGSDNGNAVTEIERNLRISEHVLRFMTVKMPVEKPETSKKSKKKTKRENEQPAQA